MTTVQYDTKIGWRELQRTEKVVERNGYSSRIGGDSRGNLERGSHKCKSPSFVFAQLGAPPKKTSSNTVMPPAMALGRQNDVKGALMARSTGLRLRK